MRAPAGELKLLFENAPGFVARLQVISAPTWEELLDEAQRIALSMPEDEQIDLLNAHPPIGAAPTDLSVLSYREQGFDKERGTNELQARLDRLNSEYEARNGFRFVIFVNGRSRAEIADVLEARLDSPRDEEKRRALEDVIAIARSRLARLMEEQPA